jgi:hypothetical protein
MVEGVLYTDAHRVWPRIEGWLQACIDKIDGGYTTEDLLTEIQLRRKQLWLIDDKAVGITSIIRFPQWKKLLVEYLGGSDMEQWEDDWFSCMDRYARENQCKYIEVYGRKGWARIAKSRGDRVETMTYSRKTL